MQFNLIIYLHPGARVQGLKLAGLFFFNFHYKKNTTFPFIRLHVD